MRALLIAAILLATAAVPARAEVFAVPFAGIKFGGGTSIVDLEVASGGAKFSMGGSVIRTDQSILGYDLTFGYIPAYLERDDAPEPLVKPGSFAIDLTGSVLLSLPANFTGGGLRPYAAIGAGLIHVQAEDSLETFTVRRTVPVFSVGGGASGLITNNVGVRFDYRYLRSLTTDDGYIANIGRRISYSRLTVGLLLRL
jgi:opacity protein-like surface antigen